MRLLLGLAFLTVPFLSGCLDEAEPAEAPPPAEPPRPSEPAQPSMPDRGGRGGEAGPPQRPGPNETLYVNGTATSAGHCLGGLGYEVAPLTAIVPVPPDAQGGAYSGPTMSGGTDSGLGGCVTWLDASKNVIRAVNPGIVPDAAAYAQVQSPLNVDSKFSIRIDPR